MGLTCGENIESAEAYSMGNKFRNYIRDGHVYTGLVATLFG